jgi:uncharacterized protein YndB with AHSA1/START domain
MSHQLTVQRLIDATPEEAFAAYTDRAAVNEWMTLFDPGMIVETEIDLRVGGLWVSAWGFSTDEMFRETQTFVVIDRPHRLVTRSTGSSPDGLSVDTEIEITFEGQDGKTLMTVVQTGFPDEATRDFFAETAWNGFFDRFNGYFAAIDKV